MKKKRRKLMKPVTAGFGALYLVVMLLSTYLVKTKFADSYEETLKETLSNLQKRIYEQEQEPPDTWDAKAKHIWYQNLANAFLWQGEEFMKFSVAVYDEQGELLAKSANTIGTSLVSLDEILPQEDKEILAGCQAENFELEGRMEPPRYEIQVREGEQIFEIFVQEYNWKRKDELEKNDNYTNSHFYVRPSYVDWFGNPYYSDSKDEEASLTWYETGSTQIWNRTIAEMNTSFPPRIQGVSTSFPYIEKGYKNWEKWDKSTYLHNFSQKADISEWNYNIPVVNSFSKGIKNLFMARLSYEPDSDILCYLEVRMESTPWLAAMDYMKYVYISGFILMLACMIKIIYSAGRLYDQQEALEETRRDFINAMAHELKTPLGIIRNFAENLLENHMEEKRDYYLEQIVGQTEEMDRLAGEMILVSRMDSDKLVLQRETVSMEELIQEQLARLKPMTEEKQLRVELHKEQDFQVEGDRDYLAKAVWNLLSNAAAYNVPKGQIVITLNEKECSIENTGSPLSEEQLKRGFELFYSGDKSRSAKDGKHMGMGLYLAEKVLSKHGIGILLENTRLGVKVTISSESFKTLTCR